MNSNTVRNISDFSDFAELRQSGCIYVDKTAYLYQPVTWNSIRRIFAARPRRFGKSLMISTLKYILQGQKELFKGTYICDQTDYDWPETKVLHFDMSEPEYDSLKLAEAIRKKLASVYIKLKSKCSGVRFLMLTGVSRFSQLSIFSGPNNLTDLYRYDDFATMFGYTEQEPDNNFGNLMQAHAKKMKLPYDVYRAELKRWFNGYCFNAGKDTVYNPMAVAKTLSEQAMMFRSTRTAECRPSMPVNFLRRANESGFNFDKEIRVDADELGNVARIDRLQLVDVLYQSGYLTTDTYDADADQPVLRVPDAEIRRALGLIHLELMSGKHEKPDTGSMRKAFAQGKVRLFLSQPESFCAGLIYGIHEHEVTETGYQRALQIFFDVTGICNTPEPYQANGNRADLVARLGDRVWVFELKRAETASADDALKQIVDRDYMAPYRNPGCTLIQVGLAFDGQTHHLTDSKFQQFDIAIPPG